MKTVYMCFATDVIHEGHMNVVKKAKEYGKVVAGVLCDAEMVRYNRFPTVSFEERMAMVRNIPEIDEVIVQDRIMYDNVIKELKPDYVIHGRRASSGSAKNKGLSSPSGLLMKTMSVTFRLSIMIRMLELLAVLTPMMFPLSSGK